MRKIVLDPVEEKSKTATKVHPAGASA